MIQVREIAGDYNFLANHLIHRNASAGLPCWWISCTRERWRNQRRLLCLGRELEPLSGDLPARLDNLNDVKEKPQVGWRSVVEWSERWTLETQRSLSSRSALTTTRSWSTVPWWREGGGWGGGWVVLGIGIGRVEYKYETYSTIGGTWRSSLLKWSYFFCRRRFQGRTARTSRGPSLRVPGSSRKAAQDETENMGWKHKQTNKQTRRQIDKDETADVIPRRARLLYLYSRPTCTVQ